MTSNKNSKLTPVKVKVTLASGRTIQAVRHKNLAVPRPSASTPPAGPAAVPAVVPDLAEELPEIKKPVRYARTMGGFVDKHVLTKKEADVVCAKTYFETLESYDAWGETSGPASTSRRRSTPTQSGPRWIKPSPGRRASTP